MMRLLPGDQLWDRYRVDHVGADPLAGAWLSVLRPDKGADADSAPHFLLIPLENSGRHALSEILALTGDVARLNKSSRGKTRKIRARRPANAERETGGWTDVPLLGPVEWLGEPAQGGVAIVHASPGTTLSSSVHAARSLAPAQALHVAVNLSAALSDLQEMLIEPDAGQYRADQVLRAMARLLHPEGLVLRTGDGKPNVRMALLEADKQSGPRPWADFLAPELYQRSGSVSPASLAFGVARVAAFSMGIRTVSDGPPNEELAWAQLADWVGGRRDPAREFLDAAAGMDVPEELRDLLARCLAKRPAKRVQTPSRLKASLEQLRQAEWARAAAPCAACGFLLMPNPGNAGVYRCPCCRRDNLGADIGFSESGTIPAQSATPSKSSGRHRRGGTGTVPKPAESGITAAAAGAPEGMTLIAAGTFLSGERRVPRTLRAFAIDTVPVTEGDYKQFLSGSGKKARPGGPGTRVAAFDRYPVTNITWYEANEFAEFNGKRLPTVYEWEKASRGTDGRKFPFGNAFKAGCGRLRVNGEDGVRKIGEENGPAPVGSYRQGASPFGVLDMAGNVLEWTCSARRAGERLFRAVKGACYTDGSTELARCTSVQYLRPESAEGFLGFRCVKDVE